MLTLMPYLAFSSEMCKCVGVCFELVPNPVDAENYVFLHSLKRLFAKVFAYSRE